MKRLKTISLTPLFFLLLICCEQKQCINFLNEYPTNDKPLFHITSNQNSVNCEYPVITDLWADSIHIYSLSHIRVFDHKIQIKIDSLSSEFCDFLDFSKSKGELYSILLSKNNERFEFKIRIEDKVKWSDQDSEATIFRINKALNYFNHFYDIILIATLRNGVIGSHFTGVFQNKEFILAPAGYPLLKERGLKDIEIRVLD